MNIPVLSGACVVYNNKVLLVQNPKRKWGPPGGHGNDNESLVETAVRETKEETGLDIEILGLVQAGLAYTPNGKMFVIAAYLAKAKNPNSIKIDPKEVTDYKWATLEEIKKDKSPLRDPIIKPILLKALTQDPVPVDSFILVRLEDNY